MEVDTRRARRTAPTTQIEADERRTVPATRIQADERRTVPAIRMQADERRTVPAIRMQADERRTVPAIPTARTLRSRLLEINIEKILLVSFIILFVILIVAQASLTNPSIRAKLFIIDGGIEGTPLKSEEFLYQYGEITLKLLSKRTNRDVKILVNGDEKAVFLDNETTIRVRDGDIVEVDGSEIPDYIDIEVVSKSNNIKSDCLGQKFRIKSQVKKIIKAKIE